MYRLLILTSLAVALTTVTACKRNDAPVTPPTDAGDAPVDARDEDAPAATQYPDHEHADAPTDADDGHEHGEEIDLGTITLDDMEVSLAQGHGSVMPGEEGHLVVKLPYSDDGASILRAWLGTDDRTLSFVGKGVYAPDHDDYDIHAVAPDPLPEDVAWWIEIERPDGTTLVGSVAPYVE